jgi:hypothetical protein
MRRRLGPGVDIPGRGGGCRHRRGLRPISGRWRLVRGVIVTAGDAVIVSTSYSFLRARVEVAEDPVTGSAHCTLGPRGPPARATDLRGWQASARGGEVGVRVAGARVELRGQAVTVWRGTLVAPAA